MKNKPIFSKVTLVFFYHFLMLTVYTDPKDKACLLEGLPKETLIKTADHYIDKGYVVLPAYLEPPTLLIYISTESLVRQFPRFLLSTSFVVTSIPDLQQKADKALDAYIKYVDSMQI